MFVVMLVRLVGGCGLIGALRIFTTSAASRWGSLPW